MRTCSARALARGTCLARTSCSMRPRTPRRPACRRRRGFIAVRCWPHIRTLRELVARGRAELEAAPGKSSASIGSRGGPFSSRLRRNIWEAARRQFVGRRSATSPKTCERSGRCWRKKMGKKRKVPKLTREDHARHARIQEMVRERIAYHEAKAREEEETRRRA